MSNSKKARLPEEEEEVDMVEEEGSGDDDGSDEDIQMDVDAGWSVSMDVTGYGLKDDDFHGIKQLLEQLFTKNLPIQLSEFADALIAQNTIGTLLKDTDEPSEGDDDIVYALVSCYSLTRSKKSQLLTSLRNLLLSKCQSSNASTEDKAKFSKIISNSWSENGDITKCETCVGLFLNERYINLPFEQAGSQMFASLMEEIKEAKSSMRRQQVRHDFTHIVMISKISKETNNEISYLNNEDEELANEALVSFDFDVTSHHTVKSRRILLLEAEAFKRIITNV